MTGESQKLEYPWPNHGRSVMLSLANFQMSSRPVKVLSSMIALVNESRVSE
ncbi:hypothetical protein D3C72_2471940 [compost metagenome]